MFVVCDPHAKENVYVCDYTQEKTCAYQEAKRALKARGFVITAIVGDRLVVVL